MGLKNNCNFSCEDLEAKDEANHFFEISLNSGEQKIISSKGKISITHFASDEEYKKRHMFVFEEK